MARSSPGVARVVAILNFMADHPGEAFTLTDIVRALKLSRATCHALLSGLVEANYLYRTTDKSYVLGSALVAIGRTAAEHVSPLRAARPEMRALADEFDAICSAVVREGAEVVVRERSASRSHLGWSVPRGTRLPLVPPTHIVFTAWGTDGEADAFLDEAMPRASAEYRAEMHAGIALTRRLGFQTLLRARADMGDAAGWILSEPKADAPIAVASVLEPDRDYPLTSLVAPVFDARGQIEFVLGLMGFTGDHRGEAVLRMGARLREACDRLTACVGGRIP